MMRTFFSGSSSLILAWVCSAYSGVAVLPSGLDVLATCADGPDWLVGDHHFAPVFDDCEQGLELSFEHLLGLVRFHLLQGLSDAEDDADPILDCEGGL